MIVYNSGRTRHRESGYNQPSECLHSPHSRAHFRLFGLQKLKKCRECINRMARNLEKRKDLEGTNEKENCC